MKLPNYFTINPMLG